MLEDLKQGCRRLEARVTPFERTVVDGRHTFAAVRSLWWDDAFQESFEQEIGPYLRALGGRTAFRAVLDAGAATGLFVIPACLRFPDAKIYAFEPSARQRIVLGRNLRKNGLAARVRVEPKGLWNRADKLAFRTHGAMSVAQSVSALPPELKFNETVDVVALDAWASEVELAELDLVKMDIEGAEIEALCGAEQTLRRFKPEILLQAYHLRDGKRTFETCRDFLEDLGYHCVEFHRPSGFLHASSDALNLAPGDEKDR